MTAPTHVPAIEFKDGVYTAILMKLDDEKYPDVVLCSPKYINGGFRLSRQLDKSNVTINWSCLKSKGYLTEVQVICNRFIKIVESFDVMGSGVEETTIALNKYSNLNEDQVLDIFFQRLNDKCNSLQEKIKTYESVFELLKVKPLE